MAQARPYYSDKGLSTAFYDLVTAADRSLVGDTELYAGLVTPGGQVLELGCGTGRISLDLAARGFRVVGVDISPAMLAKARAAVAQTPAEVAARVELRQGDMTALNLGRTFDLVICPFFTLAHVPTGAAWRNAFAVMAHHMAPQGLVAVHLPLAELMRGPPPPPDRPVMDQPLPGGGRLRLFVLARSFREGVNRLDQVIEYVELDAAGQVVRRSPERLTYYVADPRPFAEDAGLTLDRPPIAHGGSGEIFVFRKR